MGQQMRPRHADPLAKALDPAEMDGRLGSLRSLVAGCVQTMPSPEAFIAAQAVATDAGGQLERQV